VVSPNGKERYRLALVPLWAVEGGILGIEVLVARPEHPDDNLLGQRQSDVPQPFVVTVEDLESGINKSRFGPIRDFKLDRTTLRVEIQGSRLGEGVGECKDCKNIQELTVDFTFGSKSGSYLPQPIGEGSLSVVTAPTAWHRVEAGAFAVFAPSGWEFHQLQGLTDICRCRSRPSLHPLRRGRNWAFLHSRTVTGWEWGKPFRLIQLKDYRIEGCTPGFGYDLSQICRTDWIWSTARRAESLIFL
jgi:hypothetical protein